MPTKDDDNAMQQRGVAGIAVDAYGGGTIDPTKNVLDLVRAESKYQDAMRNKLQEVLQTHIDAVKDQIRLATEGMTAFQNAQIAAETRRIDQLAQTRQEFQNTIRDMLAESVRTTSTLVSTQLVQIQATFDTRVSKLEAGAFTQAGKQSVADPAISDALIRMTAGLSQVKIDTDALISKMAMANAEQISKLTTAINTIGERGASTSGAEIGRGQIVTWIIASVVAVGGLTTLISFVLRSVGH
jgi:hypothetical protein